MAWNDARLTEHPLVCSVLELSGFGERNATTIEGTYGGKEGDHAPDLDAFKAHMRYCVVQHDKKYAAYFGADGTPRWSNKMVHRQAVIYAFTSSLQPVAESYLKALGFRRVGPVKKLKHPDSKLSVWTIRCTKFLKMIKE